MSATLRVALTGGIGSGKSTVASQFQQLGVPIIDSDVISRDIVSPKNPCFNNVIKEFGSDILDMHGTIDRSKLRKIIFNDNLAKQKLEEILHPAIYLEIENQISNTRYPYCLIVVPLLIETQATSRFDKVLVVDTTEALQITRASCRDNLSTDNIKKIIKSQASQKQRLEFADDVINNSLTIEELKAHVAILHEKYMNLSSYNFQKN